MVRIQLLTSTVVSTSTRGADVTQWPAGWKIDNKHHQQQQQLQQLAWHHHCLCLYLYCQRQWPTYLTIQNDTECVVNGNACLFLIFNNQTTIGALTLNPAGGFPFPIPWPPVLTLPSNPGCATVSDTTRTIFEHVRSFDHRKVPWKFRNDNSDGSYRVDKHKQTDKQTLLQAISPSLRWW